MQESVGKRLSIARLARGLTVDDAAHATRMRPDKIIALENDDYGRFGGNAYAKGFLLIYSRFLKVDAVEEARSLKTPKNIPINDYQYLANAAPTPVEGTRQPQRSFRPQNRPSATPLLVSVIVVIVAIIGYYVYIQASRLTGPALDRPPSTAQSPLAPATSAAEDLAPAPATTGTTAGPDIEAPSATDPASPPEERMVINGEPLQETTPPSTNEISVGTKKKTWVRIFRDDPNSPPIFDDYLYPDAGPMKLPKRGTRFFIDAQDPSAIEVRKNGAPVAYHPGAAIQ